MNALFLKDLAQKTHQGLAGSARDGKSAGGKSYGYGVIRELDEQGEPLANKLLSPHPTPCVFIPISPIITQNWLLIFGPPKVIATMRLPLSEPSSMKYGFTLTAPSKKVSYTTPLEYFPQSFRDEVAALVDHWSGKDILDETAPMKPLKPRTIKTRLYRLRQIASALVIEGTPIEEIASLATLTQIETAKTVLRFYLKKANDQTTSQVHGLAILIKTLAKYWVRVDDEHLEKLKELCSRVDPKFKGLTEKNKSRLRQFDDPRNVRLLLNFPQQQVAKIQRDDRGLRNEAVAVQIALAVEILLMAPMRAANLVNININHHIQRSRNGKSGVVHIVIPGSEVKNGDDLEYELPLETVELLDLYLKHYHPRLKEGDCSWLFPGKENGPKSRELFGDQISKHVFKATGLSINLHLFRHISAKLYLDNNPGSYEVVRRHLGHRSTETTLRFYSGTEQATASRHFDKTILGLRHGASSPNRAE